MDAIVRILEDSPTITGDYDKEADVLYLSFKKVEEAVAIELGDRIIARYDEESQSIVGITLIGLRESVVKELNHKLHVEPHTDGWVVTEETVKSAPKMFPNLKAALKYAVGMAKAQWLDVVIYAENGEIQEVINPGMDAILERRRDRRESEIEEIAALPKCLK